MTEDVKKPELVKTESDKEINFRRLERARDEERDRALKAEMREEQLRAELQEIRKMLQPAEKDPLDEVEDYPDAKALKAKFEKERSSFEKKAEEIARKAYREEKEREEKGNYLQRLKSQYSDYDQIMTQEAIAELQELDPLFVETVLKVPDDYDRRLTTYKRLKSRPSAKQEEKKDPIQEKVDENAMNPFFIPSSAPTPSVVDYDLKSPQARQQAYQKLKQAQRRSV